MPFDFLVVEGGHTRALPFPADHFFIGSDAQCELRFSPSQVQPRHAEIKVTQDRAFLTDLTGKGLTWVNGMLVEKGELHPGMLVRFGRVELMVRFERPRVSGVAPEPSPSTAGQAEPSAPAPEAIEAPIDATARRATPFREPLSSSPSQAPTPVPAPEPVEVSTSGRVALGDDRPQATAGGSRPLSIGTIIDDRYLILARLAAGGMGEVYKAQHVELGKLIAIKVMRRQLSQDAEFVGRFKREAIATSGIGQINIVDISDFGRTQDGRFYFAMEFIDGMTLASLVHREGPQPVDRVLAIAVQIARALAAAHSLGVVHRDLKPENVMLLQRPSQRDFVKVVDFGVAKLPVAEGTKGHTAIGMVVGTPQYMSPEQAKAIPVDARSDIYSLGLIIYELLAGRPTFDAETPASLMVKQVTETPAPLELGDDAPSEFLALIDAMLAKSPDDRPQTMAEVVERLEGLLGIGEGRAGLAGFQGTTTPTKSTPTRTSPQRTPKTSPPRTAGVSLGPSRLQATDTGSQAVVEAEGKADEGEAEAEAIIATGYTSRAPLYAVAAIVAVGLIGGAVWLFSGREPAPAPTPVVATETPTEKVEPEKPREGVKPSDGVSPSAVIPPSSTASIEFTSSPPGADVYEGKVKVGTTPFKLARPSAHPVELRFVLEGHRPVTQKFGFAKDGEVAIRLDKVASSGPPPPVEVHRPAEQPPPATVEVKKPPPETKPELPSLIDDPYADKNKTSKPLKDVAY